MEKVRTSMVWSTLGSRTAKELNRLTIREDGNILRSLTATLASAQSVARTHLAVITSWPGTIAEQVLAHAQVIAL